MKLSLLTTHLFASKALVRWLLGSVAACVAIIVTCLYLWPIGKVQAVEATAALPMESNEPIQPIEALRNLSPEKIALGRKLFHDPRLSRDNSLACVSCHDLKTGGTDRRARSIGINNSVGVINAPTVLNSGFNSSQFWDGRAPTLEKQIDEPIESKIEMSSSWPEVIGKLERAPDYPEAFRQVYGRGIQSDDVKDSIAEFERSLATPNSRFDRYLRHDANALTSGEQHGYQLFKSFGCASCHQGVNAGGNMYQKLGVMAPYFADRGHITRADRGRFNVTGDPKDIYMFKVPSLRNVALTAPYFHDGNAPRLEDAVRIMAKYQLGRSLSDQEVELIVAFLKTLTGELNGKAL